MSVGYDDGLKPAPWMWVPKEADITDRFLQDLDVLFPLWEGVGDAFDVQSGLRGVLVGGASWDVGPIGPGAAIAFNAEAIDIPSSQARFKYYHGADGIADLKLTVHSLISIDDPSADEFWALFGNNGFASGSRGISVGIDNRTSVPATRRLRAIISFGTGGQRIIDHISADNTYPNDSLPHLVTWTYDHSLSTLNGRFYIDGVLVDTENAIKQGSTTLDATDDMELGNIGTQSSTFGLHGRHYFQSFHRSVWRPSEVLELANDLSIFNTIRRKI